MSTGRRIGSYEVERELGQGGMGVVYLARQPGLDRRVVLKTLRRDRVSEPSLKERFEREAQAAASIHHQNVVSVYDCFAWRGEHYFAQEYVCGDDLATVLERVGRIEARTAAVIALELVRGLEEIHARGLVHRDLKPSNILLGREGEAKIADFGIALDPRGPALTRTGYAIGTPPYMSPEQLLGERVDARSDVYSFGVVLYEMLVGAPPFQEVSEAEEGMALLRRMEAERYRPPRELAPHTSRSVARLLKACLRPQPHRRPPSSQHLRRALEQRLGAPSPADCRAEIAAWLQESAALSAPIDEEARPKTVVIGREKTAGLTAQAAPFEAEPQPDAAEPLETDAARSLDPERERGDAVPIGWVTAFRWAVLALVLGVLLTSAVAVDLRSDERPPAPPDPLVAEGD